MQAVFPFLLLLTMSLTTACDDRNDLNPPWSSATFLEPLPTELTVTNDTDTAVAIGLFTTDLPGVEEGDYPDTLAAGAAFTVTADLFRPRGAYIDINDAYTGQTLFPGVDRRLSWGGQAFTNEGTHKTWYDFYDPYVRALNRPGPAPALTDVAEYGDTLRSRLPEFPLVSPDIPAWLVEFTKKDVELSIAYNQYSLRGYYRAMLADTLPIPPELSTRARALVGDPLAFYSPNYPLFSKFYAWHLRENEELAIDGVSPRNARIATDFLADSFPLPEKRNDAIASYLYDKVHETKMYAGKVENMDRLLAELPTDYRGRLLELRTKVERAFATDDGHREFLNTPLATLDGREITPTALRSKPKTLFKFWFEGCRPCLIQQPDEEKLLAENPDLELIYVAFSTQKDRIPAYLDKHAPPATAHLYLPKTQTELVRKATGRTGAPTYLLVVGDEVVCRNCPKPSDALFKDLL